MANFRDFKFDQSEVSAMAVDTDNGQYLWIAFKQKDGVCLLKKVSAHDLSQTYFSVSVPVTSINAMVILNSVIYLAVTDSTYAIYAYSTSSPLSGSLLYTLAELNLVESPIAMVANTTNFYLLTAGESSGEPAQIAILDSDGNYVETIDLLQSAILVKYAISFTIDDDDNFWVVTENDPSELYRVFNQYSAWQIQENILP